MSVVGRRGWLSWLRERAGPAPTPQPQTAVPVGGLIEVPAGKTFDEAYADWKRNDAQVRADAISQAVAAESEWWIRVPVGTIRRPERSISRYDVEMGCYVVTVEDPGLAVMHRGDLWNARWWPTDGYMCEGDLYGAPLEAPT